MTDYKKIYTEKYFLGKSSFFYKFTGYRNFRFFDQYYRLVSPYLASKSRILDVGCALGFLLQRFASKSHQVWGIDVSEYAIGVAKKALPGGKFLTHDVQNPFPFEKNFFDAATATDILEHLEHPEKTLAHIHRVLKPGGIIFIGAPHNNWLRKILYALPDKLEHHTSLFTLAKLKKMVEESGFEIIDAWTVICAYTSEKKMPHWLNLESRLLARKK